MSTKIMYRHVFYTGK